MLRHLHRTIFKIFKKKNSAHHTTKNKTIFGNRIGQVHVSQSLQLIKKKFPTDVHQNLMHSDQNRHLQTLKTLRQNYTHSNLI